MTRELELNILNTVINMLYKVEGALIYNYSIDQMSEVLQRKDLHEILQICRTEFEQTLRELQVDRDLQDAVCPSPSLTEDELEKQ